MVVHHSNPSTHGVEGKKIRSSRLSFTISWCGAHEIFLKQIQNNKKTKQNSGRRGGSAIKSTHCSCSSIGPQFNSQHLCNSSLKTSDTLFWPPQALLSLSFSVSLSVTEHPRNHWWSLGKNYSRRLGDGSASEVHTLEVWGSEMTSRMTSMWQCMSAIQIPITRCGERRILRSHPVSLAYTTENMKRSCLKVEGKEHNQGCHLTSMGTHMCQHSHTQPCTQR